MRSDRPPRLALLLAVLFVLAPLLALAPPPLQLPAAAEGGVSAPLRVRSDATPFVWQPPEGEAQPANVSLIGEWDWSNHTDLTLNTSTRVWSTNLSLSSGLYCYKFVIGEADYRFDPDNAYRGYCGAYENSLIRVANHTRSTFTLELDMATGLPSRILLHAGSDGSGLSTGGPQFLDGFHPGVTTFNMTSEAWDLDLSVLPDGKHTIHVTGVDDDGDSAEDLLIPFWTGSQADFVWDDALIYMVMTDRFVNGNTSNDPADIAVASQGADWMGGDIAGVTQMIESGYFDDLGVNALWMTPLNAAANGTGTSGDGAHEVSGFHGYWPVQPRQVDARLGSEEELEGMVAAAHAHGIRVMADLVVNHVHEDHPYYSDHPDWFNQGCLCGSTDCDWTEHRLDCLFRDYMPDIDWKNRNASEAMIADALWWLERFDLDGARIDAVKHVDDLAVTNLAMRVNERFEIGGLDYYLKGETAMGWVGDDLAANAGEYEMINRYIGPNGLDGQADFVLYHAVVDNVFTKYATGDAAASDYQHLDYWTARSQDQYVDGATMVPFIGSHDVPRFASRADAGTADEWNQWVEQGLPGQPGDDSPYSAALQAFTWLLTTPGAPMLYAGDEYGEYGGADPDNRHMWRAGGARNARENGLAENISAIATLRDELTPLRRGSYASLDNSTDAIAWSMATTDDSAVVVMNRAASPHSFSLDLSDLPTLSVDELTGQPTGWVGAVESRFGNVTMTDGSLTLTANSVAIFAPRAASNGGGSTAPLPPTDCAPLNLSIIDTPALYDPLGNHLPKAISVFGVHLLAAPDVANSTLRHAAAVLAGYLDNDADGVADDLAVVQAMVDANAAMVIPRTPGDMDDIIATLPESFHERLDSGELALQDLYESEVHPGGRGTGDFDATLEEVLHLVTHVGYSSAHPTTFAESPGSTLTDAMDVARGGHFEENDPDDCESEQGPCALPAGGYPASAWYHYDDGTCDYSCMATEYIYWALTTHMGVQNDSARCAAIDHEWEPCTAAELAATDPAIVSLIENSSLPKAIPSGEHCPPADNNGGNGTGNGTGNNTGNGTGNGTGNQTDDPADPTNDSTDDPIIGPAPVLERKVLIIGIDGVRGDVAEASALRNGSAFGRLQAEGAWSFESTVGPISISGPSWSSMLTGVWCDRHGVVDNSFDGSLHDEVPDMFQRIESHDSSLRTAAILRWSGIDEEILGDRSADIQEDHDSDGEVRDRAIGLLANDTDLDVLFLNMDDPDHAGHENGFSPDSPGYVEAVEAADDMAAAILTALDARNTTGEEWLVIITSDHGGGGEWKKSHSPSTLIDRTTLMLVIGGDTVPGEMTNGPVVIDTAVTALTHLEVALPAADSDDALDGRAAAFDPDAAPARVAQCERPGAWFQSKTNIAMASLGGLLVIALAVLGLLKARGRSRSASITSDDSDWLDLDDSD